MNALGRNSFALQVSVPVLGRREKQVRQLIGQHAVDLLRHTAVERAQPGFHMGDTKRMQFLLEAVALTLVGGTLGILVGATVSTLVRAFVPSIPATLSYLWVAIGFTISVGVGLFFGYYPANLAANMDPIVCLHYE